MAQSTSTQSITFKRLPEVCDDLKLSKSAIYDLINAGKFPKPIKITKRASAWLESDIETFKQNIVKQYRGA